VFNNAIKNPLNEVEEVNSESYSDDSDEANDGEESELKSPTTESQSSKTLTSNEISASIGSFVSQTPAASKQSSTSEEPLSKSR
jgi:hypothetical protein